MSSTPEEKFDRNGSDDVIGAAKICKATGDIHPRLCQSPSVTPYHEVLHSRNPLRMTPPKTRSVSKREKEGWEREQAGHGDPLMAVIANLFYDATEEASEWDGTEALTDQLRVQCDSEMLGQCDADTTIAASAHREPEREKDNLGEPPTAFNTAEEASEWEGIEDRMEQLRAQCDSDCDVAIAAAQRYRTTINEIEGAKGTLHKNARGIGTLLRSKIDGETEALANDSGDLARLEKHVRALEVDLEELCERNADLITKRRAAEHNIPIYKADAAEKIEKLSEVEMQCRKEVPRAKQNHSIFAQVTNIKWDYSNPDVLAGEVALPRKSSVRKFEVDKDLSPFEITEKLWRIIDGV